MAKLFEPREVPPGSPLRWFREAFYLYSRAPLHYAALTLCCLACGPVWAYLPVSTPALVCLVIGCLVYGAAAFAGTLVARHADLGSSELPADVAGNALRCVLAVGVVNPALAVKAIDFFASGPAAWPALPYAPWYLFPTVAVYIAWGFTSVPLLALGGARAWDSFRLHVRAEVELNWQVVLWLWAGVMLSVLLALALTIGFHSDVVLRCLWPFLFNLSYVAYRDIWERRAELSPAPFLLHRGLAR